jgi:hypothetical protein
MRPIARSSGCAAALVLAGAAALAAPAAAQASVRSGPPVVPCSATALVTAIQQASSLRSAALRLSAGCNYVLTRSVSGGDGLPAVTGNLTIAGGPGTTISRSSSAGAFRILEVAAGARLTLASVTVTGGAVPTSQGGGILDEGSVTLRNVRLTGNTALSGGGLFVDTGANAAIRFSELSGNDATGDGGAVLNVGDLAVDHSRLAGNTAGAGDGGGVNTQKAGTSRISSTLVTGNRAGGQGGGLSSLGTTILTGDRVVFNHASAGGGIATAPGAAVVLRFTVVAFNSPDNCHPQGIIRGCRH